VGLMSRFVQKSTEASIAAELQEHLQRHQDDEPKSFRECLHELLVRRWGTGTLNSGMRPVLREGAYLTAFMEWESRIEDAEEAGVVVDDETLVKLAAAVELDVQKGVV
jgi:hypothetical protein